MKSMKLSLLAAACVLALTACSSSKDKGSNYLNSEANKRIAELNAQITAEKKKAAEAEEKLIKAKQASETNSEANKRIAELNAQVTTEKAKVAAAEEEAKAAKQAGEAAQQNAKTALDGLTAEKSRLEAELAEANAKLAALQQEKQAELDRIAAAEKAEKERVESNTAAVKEAVKETGTVEKKYTKIDAWSGTSTEETLNLSKVSGKVLTSENGNLTEQPFQSSENNDLNILVIDGKPITLYSVDEVRASTQQNRESYAAKNLAADGMSGKVGSLSTTRFGGDFDQIRYGYVTTNGKTQLFIQGHTTPETESVDSPFDRYNYGGTRDNASAELGAMPTGDKVWAYQGTAFYGKDGNYQELAVDAVADFGNKKVRADLKEGENTKVTLGGKIEGNTFVGEHNGVVTSGAFYGDQAQDMGGIFYHTSGDNKDKNGVFGATTPSSSSYRFVPTNVLEKALTDFTVNP